MKGWVNLLNSQYPPPLSAGGAYKIFNLAKWGDIAISEFLGEEASKKGEVDFSGEGGSEDYLKVPFNC